MMNTSDRHGNGSKDTIGTPFTTEVIEENPYFKRPTDEPVSDKRNADDEPLQLFLEDEDGPPTEEANQVNRVSQRRRRLALIGMALLLLLALVFAIALYRRSPTRVDYGRTAKRPDMKSSPTNTVATAPRDSRTDKAIAEAQQLTASQPKVELPHTSEVDVAPPKDESKIDYESPFKTPIGNQGTNTSIDIVGTNSQPTEASARPIANGTATPNGQPGTRSQRSSETSLYMSVPVAERMPSSPTQLTNGIQKKTAFNFTERNVSPSPTFGSMLPVRTLGALYTLRIGALVRLELTRDMKGEGWSLKRGTILVGSTKGSDLDRAYVSLVGFIDSETGKLMKLGGDVLGGDGALGLKGKRRRIDGGWAKALGRFASSALDVTGALLSGHGRDTVIVTEGLRTRAMNPLTEEINGVLGNELNGKQSRGFVEVVAGTPAYILVTDLPTTTTSQEVNSETLASLADVDSTRTATGLTERELADLLASGSPEQIRAAMPRMSPDMRKITQLVLNQ
jgi:hypothetical protein